MIMQGFDSILIFVLILLFVIVAAFAPFKKVDLVHASPRAAGQPGADRTHTQGHKIVPTSQVSGPTNHIAKGCK